jgi:sugar lactone lactonase YvrE
LYVADNANRQAAQVDVLLSDDLSRGVVDKYRSSRMQFPDGIFVDTSGKLYVPNEAQSGHDTVFVYAKNEKNPIRIYRGIECAFDVVVGTDGTVYVADPCGTDNHGVVDIYAPGHTTPTRRLHPHCAPNSLTLDDQNDLYVACLLPRSYWSEVKRFAPHSSEGVDLLLHQEVFFAGGIALDRHGDLLVEDGGRSAIDVFTVENRPPAQVIKTGQSTPYRFALNAREDRLYVSSPYLPDARVGPGHSGPQRPNTVVELDYPSGKRLHTIRRLVKGWLPTGIAVYPRAPFGARF